MTYENEMPRSPTFSPTNISWMFSGEKKGSWCIRRPISNIPISLLHVNSAFVGRFGLMTAGKISAVLFKLHAQMKVAVGFLRRLLK